MRQKKGVRSFLNCAKKVRFIQDHSRFVMGFFDVVDIFSQRTRPVSELESYRQIPAHDRLQRSDMIYA